MKKGIITVLMIVVVGGILVTTGCRKPGESRSDYIIDEIADKLELTEAQSEWLDGFKADLRADIDQMKQEREATRESIKNSFIGGVLTEKMLNDEIKKRCNLFQEKTPIIVAKIAEIHDNLTLEQRSELRELMKDFHDKKEKWKKGCKFFKSDGSHIEKIVGHISEKVQDELDLSNEQIEWLEIFTAGIIEDPAIKNLKEDIQSVKKQVIETLMAEFANETFDTEKITEFIKTNLPLEQVKELPIAAKLIEIQTNLNAEQRVELVAMINRHKEERKGFWSKRHCFFKK